jgi:hypothetical protein
VYFSLPPGGGSLRNTVSHARDRSVTASTTYDGQFWGDKHYSLGVSGSADEQRISACTSMNRAYTQVGAGDSQTSRQSTSAYLSATGRSSTPTAWSFPHPARWATPSALSTYRASPACA